MITIADWVIVFLTLGICFTSIVSAIVARKSLTAAKNAFAGDMVVRAIQYGWELWKEDRVHGISLEESAKSSVLPYTKGLIEAIRNLDKKMAEKLDGSLKIFQEEGEKKYMEFKKQRETNK